MTKRSCSVHEDCDTPEAKQQLCPTKLLEARDYLMTYPLFSESQRQIVVSPDEYEAMKKECELTGEDMETIYLKQAYWRHVDD